MPLLHLLIVATLLLTASVAAAEIVVPCETVSTWPSRTQIEYFIRSDDASVVEALEALEESRHLCAQPDAHSASLEKQIHTDVVALASVYESMKARLPRQIAGIRRQCAELHYLPNTSMLDDFRSNQKDKSIDRTIDRLRPRLEVSQNFCKLPRDDDEQAWIAKLGQWREQGSAQLVFDDDARQELRALRLSHRTFTESRRRLQQARQQMLHNLARGEIDAEQANVFEGDFEKCEEKFFSLSGYLTSQDELARWNEDVTKCVDSFELAVDKILNPNLGDCGNSSAWPFFLLILLGFGGWGGRLVLREREDKLKVLVYVGDAKDRLDFARQRLDAMRTRIQRSRDAEDETRLERCDALCEIGEKVLEEAEKRLRSASRRIGLRRRVIKGLQEDRIQLEEDPTLRFTGTLDDLLSELEMIVEKLRA